MLRLFTAHPASVGESYAEHFAVASRFGVTMIWGGARCCVHALLPFMWKSAGSDTIAALNTTLVEKRRAQAQLVTVDYVI